MATDRADLSDLFATTIRDTFWREGILASDPGDLDREIAAQVALLDRDLESEGTGEHFLIARHGDQVIGTAAFGPADKLIRSHLAVDFSRTPEIKSVYILPDWQGRGIGGELFNEILKQLRERHISHYCLDSGYRSAQRYWIYKLGEPTVVLPDYWDPGAPHMIWYREVAK